MPITTPGLPWGFFLSFSFLSFFLSFLSLSLSLCLSLSLPPALSLCLQNASKICSCSSNAAAEPPSPCAHEADFFLLSSVGARVLQRTCCNGQIHRHIAALVIARFPDIWCRTRARMVFSIHCRAFSATDAPLGKWCTLGVGVTFATCRALTRHLVMKTTRMIGGQACCR